MSINRNATDNDTIKYREHRRILNRVKQKAKTSYYHDLCIKLKSKTKKLWEIVNQTFGKSNDKTCILDKLKVGNVTADNPKEILNELATYFASVGQKYANSINRADCNISDYLKKIKRNKNSLFLT